MPSEAPKPETTPTMPTPPPGRMDEIEEALKCLKHARKWALETCPEPYRSWVVDCLVSERGPF